MLTLGSTSASAASLIVPFDLNVAGDDESESRFFDTPFPDEGPTLLTLDGFAENPEPGGVAPAAIGLLFRIIHGW